MSEAPPVAAPAPRKVRVLIDRFKESGGTIVREDDSVLTIRTPEGVEKSFEKSLLLGVFPVLDSPEGTPVIIQFRDGRRVEAELVRDELHQARVRVAKVEVVLARETFWALELAPTYEDLLTQYRSNMPPTAWPQRVKLARWMLEQNHPLEAKEELTEIVRSYDAQEAHDLLARAEFVLRSQNNDTGRNASNESRGNSAKANADEIALPTHRLSPDDVNMIKVFEVNMDRPTRMDASPDLAKKIIARYSNSDFDVKMQEALVTLDDGKREALLREATAIAINDYGVIPSHFQTNTWALRKGLRYEGRTDENTLPRGVSKAE